MYKLISIELKRLLIRKRFRITFFGILIYGIYQIIYYRMEVSGPYTTYILFFHNTFTELPLFIPIVSGVICGDSVTIDREKGFIYFILSRGVSRGKYILSKGIGMATASAICWGALLFILYLICLIAFPHTTTGIISSNLLRLRNIKLFMYSPVLYVFLIIICYMLAIAAFSGISLFTSVWTKNPYVTALMPFVVFIIGLISFYGPLRIINPYAYLALNDPVQMFSPNMHTILLYWFCIIVLMLVLSTIFFNLRED